MRRIAVFIIMSTVALNCVSGLNAVDVGSDVVSSAISAESTVLSYFCLAVIPTKILSGLFNSNGIFSVSAGQQNNGDKNNRNKRNNSADVIFEVCRSEFKSLCKTVSGDAGPAAQSLLQNGFVKEAGPAPISKCRLSFFALLFFLAYIIALHRSNLPEGITSIMIFQIKNPFRPGGSGFFDFTEAL